MDNDIGAAFDKLDRLLEVAQDAGPSIALLMEAGRQQGLGDQTVQKYLKLNTTVLRWALKLSADTTADRDELTDVGELLLAWARSSAP
jgi:tRNA A37 threonylcarbamoyltransferase TsaD